ncbi:hypothetical protein CDIK_1535 [Cucumispora dikerogammari]|nr:hypothetical protein CDIK_1535 [Cucumispora dikerogammari]
MKILLRETQTEFKTSVDIQPFIESIETPNEVTFLDLSKTLIHSKAAEDLCIQIKKMNKLKHLNFSNMKPTNTMIFNKIFENINPVSIQSLNISHNFFDSKIPKGLGEFLIKADNIEYLQINNCFLGANGTISLLEKLIKGKKNLKYLNISANCILLPVDDLGKLIKHLTKLETLKMQRLEIFTGLDSLIREIKDLKLKDLDLTDNDITPKSFVLLGKMFEKGKMKSLKLRNCFIHDDALRAFLKGWKENTTLGVQKNDLNKRFKELHLNELDKINNIEINENIQFDSEVNNEEKNSQQILDLSDNGITQFGIDDLTEFMKNKMNITLYIYENYYKNISRLVDVIKKNDGVVVYEEPKCVDVSKYKNKRSTFNPLSGLISMFSALCKGTGSKESRSDSVSSENEGVQE